MADNEYKQIYDFVLESLKQSYSAPTVSLWFEPMKIVRLDNRAITVSLPQNRKAFVESQYYEILKARFAEVLGFEVDLQLISEEEEAEMMSELQDGKKAQVSEYKLRYDPEYTFKNFVVGKSNQLAQAVSLAVANHPAELNNPLFLYGNSGLGKTHLLFAIINHIREIHPDYKILYVTGEEFTNELIESLAQTRPMTFREKYRNLDVLLIDDIQFIAGKMSVQEEFFHTFDTLFKLNKQIIIASDRPPALMNNLEERLHSRFMMGMIADIQPPDKELRTAIFRRKAIDYGIDLKMDVLLYLAENITTNIRQIEGSLKKLKAHMLITGEECTLPVAKAVLSDFFVSSKNDESLVDRIFESAEKRYGVTKDEIKSTKRNAEIAMARHYCMYLIRKTTNLSLTSIAKMFNKKDHSTVINSIGFIDRKRKDEPAFDREIEQMISDLKG